jgi:hypothetical protein
MRLIKLTSINGGFIYVNIEHIGHMYQESEKKEYGRVKDEAHTKIGVTTHNNGGFKVAEDIEQILKLIDKAKGI